MKKIIEKEKKIDQLTPRQKQILLLLLEGKENKEIARYLKVTLGTVKQHINMLFKKLGVKNRTAAVSLAHYELNARKNDGVANGNEGLVSCTMGYRPVFLFSMQFHPNLSPAIYEKISYLIGFYSAQCQATFISLRNNSFYILFGIERTSCDDLLIIYHLSELFFEEAGLSENLYKIAIFTDLAKISQKKFGGWSASEFNLAASLLAEKKLTQLDFGHAYVCDKTIEVARSYNINWLISLKKRGCLNSMLSSFFCLEKYTPFLGRKEEIKKIKKGITEQPSQPLLLVGESGMGKTNIIKEIVDRFDKKNIQYIKVTTDGYLIDLSDGHFFYSLKKAGENLLAHLSRFHKKIVFFDDYHNLKKEDERQLIKLVESIANLGIKVFLSGRKGRHPSILLKGWPIINVGKMSEIETKETIKSYSKDFCLKEYEKLLNLSRNIPFFLIQVVLYREVSVSIIIKVAERIDYFNIDWDILYTLAVSDHALTVKALEEQLDGYSFDSLFLELDHAKACGVIDLNTELIQFNHPLVKLAVKSLKLGKISVF